MKLSAKLLGKNIYTYEPNIKCQFSDLYLFISRFNRLTLLRALADISNRLYESQESFIEFFNVPVTDDLIIDLAYKIIKYSNEDTHRHIADEEMVVLLNMWHYLFGKETINQTTDPNEILMLYGYKQFIFQEKGFNLVARNLYIYQKLWSQVEEAININILDEIKNIFGIPYEIAITFSFALIGGKQSYFWPYNENESHLTFLKWCSADYNKIKEHKGVINPFIKYPIIETKTKPTETLPEVYILLSKKCLLHKITSGLYFELIDKFKEDEEGNLFKTAFGYVFQEYVGILLNYYLKTWKVDREFKYKKNKNYFDTVDWLVYKDDKLVLIEVKQSSIFINSKITGKIDNIQNDFEKTLIKAVKQLKRMEEDIKSNKYKELLKYQNINAIEKLIVFNDPLYNANLIGKKIIQKQSDLNHFNFNIINISDFEVFLSNQKSSESLFDLLTYKNLNDEYKLMDFKEFLIEMYPNIKNETELEFLQNIYNEFFNNLNYSILPDAPGGAQQ